jgi:hypothetical protein
MTAEEHNKTLATLYFIYGAMHGLTLVALLLLILVLKLAVPDLAPVSRFWLVLGALVFVLLLLFVGILPVIVGFGFQKRNRRIKPLAQTLAIVSFVNAPIGTALGIYTLKFFRTEGGVSIYGGHKSSASNGELNEAMRGTEPLMNLADRLK